MGVDAAWTSSEVVLDRALDVRFWRRVGSCFALIRALDFCDFELLYFKVDK